MRQIETKVNGGLSDLLLHISGLAKNVNDNELDFLSNDLWLDISEENRKGNFDQS